MDASVRHESENMNNPKVTVAYLFPTLPLFSLFGT